MGKKIKRLIGLTTAAAAGMYCMNRIVDYTAGLKNLLTTDNGEIYHWTNGTIYYTKQGKGTPLLLIHDLNPSSSNTEWNKILYKLEKNHTVYTIDLLGCGRSDKPAVTYTNFLFVQLINHFIQEVICKKTDVIATGLSGSFVIMAQAIDAEHFGKIILVNPNTIDSLKNAPKKENKISKLILEIPILGTFIYNIMMHENKIHQKFENSFFYKKSLISTKLEDTYFESAHREKSSGKYLLASVQSNFVNIDISNAIKKSDNLYLIVSREKEHYIEATEKYLHLNKNIEVSYISNSKFLPQLEVPEKFFEVAQMFLDD